MHVVFTILKVLLWILLIILGLILILILLLLFCPFRYRLQGEKTEERLWAKVKVGWFIIGISGKYDKPAGLDIGARILGIRVFHKKMLEPKPEVVTPEGGHIPLPEGENPPPGLAEPSGTGDTAAPQQTQGTPPAEGSASANAASDSKADKKAQKKAEKEKKAADNVLIKVETAQTKADIFLDKLYTKADQLNTKKNHVFQFLDKPYTKKTLKRIKKILKRLFGTIKPKKSRAWLHIGMKSAADTGEFLGKISRFYNLYGRWLTIEPDFYYQVMEGKFDIRGRIYLFRFLFPAIGLALSPSTWKTLKMAKKI